MKISANVAGKYRTSIIDHNISHSYFSDGAKKALARPIYKKKDKQNKANYRSVNILNRFSKVYKGLVNDSMLSLIQIFRSSLVSAYREHYSANHVPISLIQNWKNNLKNNKIVGALFMDLSKAFDYIPHDLLIAKMEAYGFSEDFLTFLYSYLKRQKQSISPQYIPNSTLRCPTRIHSRTILFNNFMNDLFYFMKDAQLLSYVDDKTIATFSNVADDL